MKLAGISCAILLAASLNVAGADRRPNVIVVMADDTSARDFPVYESTRCYGERASTPVIDRLAKQGCYLTTAWSSTVCMPTRAMVMSGRYAHLTKWWDNGEFGKYRRGIYEVPVSSPLTIGHVAKQAGYRSIWAGKTHVTTGSSYTKFAFDEGVFTPGEPDVRGTSPHEHFRNVKNKEFWNSDSFLWWPEVQVANDPSHPDAPFSWQKTEISDYGPDIELDRILDFMERSKQQDKPFFVYHTSHLGHQAVDMASPRHNMTWPGTPKLTWDEDSQTYTRHEPKITPEGPVNTLSTTYKKENITPDELKYQIEYLDYQMWQYINKLKEMDELENTIVIFTSDNPAVGESLKRSEVVFPRPANPEAYRHYGATLVAWGFRSWKLTGEQLTSQWRRQCDLAHSVGARYQARVELDAGWRGWIDFDPNIEDSVCRTLEGQLLTYPFWTSTHKGKPAYHGCTNSKGYRRYLMHQAREALSINPDMLMIDAIMVTPMAIGRGGCFCDACVEGFQKYVQTNVSASELANHGIQDIADFDYGDFLRKRGVTDAQFAKQVYNLPTTLPLAQEYRTFQHVAAREFIEDFRRRAETIAGRRILLSTNSPLQDPGDWWAIPAVDFFTHEAAMNAKSRVTPWEPVFRYKLADALGVRVLSTGTPKQDWAFVRDNHLRGLVRTWIAQAYAYGHQFMVPHSMWCGEGQEQSDYQSQPGDCDDLYQFVREHAELLDGFEAVGDVGVIYSNTAFRRGQRQAQQVCYELTKRNVPFRLIAAGDEWMPIELRKESLAGLKALIVPNPSTLNVKQLAILDALRNQTLAWPDETRLAKLVPTQIRVTGAENMSVLPQVKKGDPSVLVCHLLSGNYLPESDSMQLLSNLTITLDDSLLPSPVISATLLTPGREAASCSIVRNGNGVSISVPSLDLWALLKLEMRESQPYVDERSPD